MSLINTIIIEENEWKNLAISMLDKLKFPIVLIYGNMGAGKTTFVKYLMETFNAKHQVSSPTFSLVNEYHLPEQKKIYHLDLYRLESLDEALTIGIEEYLDSGHLILIEWPQIIEPIIDENHHILKIDVLPNDNRAISFN